MPELIVTQKPIVSSNGRILTGLAARKAQLASELGLPEELKPAQMEHRIGIVFDDSGSMRPDMIEDAHVGCEEFLRYCEPNKTAVCVYPMNADVLSPSTNLPALAMLINGIRATGGTPLIQKLSKMLRENKLTRAIVFSDGQPQSYTQAEYDFCVKSKIPVDTVFIGSGYGSEFMRKLASDCNGIFLQFERGKSNFRNSFKYLSPKLRWMLADKSFADKIQGR